MNVDGIFKYNKPNETFYDILGCSISSSIDQINREYKIRALQFHPDKNPDPKSVEEFKKLQLAKEILIDEKNRKTYDSWLRSGLNISFDQFKARRGQHLMHWATPRSTNLSILNAADTKGQGSDDNLATKNNNNWNNIDCFRKHRTADRDDWLGKFRRYEV